ncbi:thiol-activated cytolysin family protein [Thermodesulfobacteriota bacterium]
MVKKTALIAILIVISITLAACITIHVPRPDSGPGTAPTPAPARPEAVSNSGINAYLASLDYDPRQILAEQVGDSVLPARPLPDEKHDDGNAIVIVKQVKHHLSGNLDDSLILSPTHSVVWPGALIKADQDLVRGTPTPIQSRRAPMWLSVDLPGIGGNGVFAVHDPSFGTVQAAIDRVLDYWNDNQYREGYVSKSRSKYTSTFVYSAEQLAASLGVNYLSLKGSLSTQFQTATSRERTVAMVLFKQVFYTVSFDPPSHAGAVFHPNVTLNDVRNQMSSEIPPAYVSSVDYGRILMLRIETSADTKHSEIEGALKYLGGQVKASAAHRKTLEKSKVTLITIGGNAEVNTRAVDASRIKDLHKIIKGKNALYSKNNPGQPIAYTVRFLKDSRLARIGYSTDYTELVSERYPHGWIGFKHSGAYIAKFYMNWKEGDQQKSWKSGKKTAGYSDVIQLKGNAREIKITAQAMTGLVWDPWGTIYKLKLDGPPNKVYKVRGTTLKRKWSVVDR